MPTRAMDIRTPSDISQKITWEMEIKLMFGACPYVTRANLSVKPLDPSCSYSHASLLIYIFGSSLGTTYHVRFLLNVDRARLPHL
jgi:hypothetical protein